VTGARISARICFVLRPRPRTHRLILFRVLTVVRGMNGDVWSRDDWVRSGPLRSNGPFAGDSSASKTLSGPVTCYVDLEARVESICIEISQPVGKGRRFDARRGDEVLSGAQDTRGRSA